MDSNGINNSGYSGLALCAAKGSPYTSDTPVRIDGNEIRQLLLAWGSDDKVLVETSDTPEPEAALARHSSPAASISPAGIVIDGGRQANITIVGSVPEGDGGATKIIDLSYLVGRNGGPLPPLQLRNCRFDGELVLKGSHLSFLAIERCWISRINGDHCRIDNHCKLTELKSITGRSDGVAQVRMLAAQIGGSLNLRGSKLKAPRPRRGDDPRQFADRYALSLASADIRGRLHLTSGFTALGGVSLYQATVRSSVSLEGAVLHSHASLSEGRRLSEEVEDSSRKSDLRKVALDAEELRLSGSFLWANEHPREGPPESAFDIAGQIVLRRAQIEGDCKFENCVWRPNREDGEDTGAADRFDGGIDIRLVRISGQFRIGNGSQLARWTEPAARRKAKDAVSGDVGASIDGWKAVIGKGVRIEAGAKLLGPVFMNDTRVEHGFIFRATVAPPLAETPVALVPEGLDLSEARISGRVLLESNLFRGSVTLRRARIDGALEVNELAIECPPLKPGEPLSDRSTGMATILDMSSARSTDAVHLGMLTLRSLGPIAERPYLVDLRGLCCRIFDDRDAQVWIGLGDQSGWRLLLDGIEFSGFDQSDPRYRSKPNTDRRPSTEARAVERTVSSRVAMLKAFAPPRGRGLIAALHDNVNSAELPDYSPQPYETFARAYFRDGKRKDGLIIAKERATLRWCRSAHRWKDFARSRFSLIAAWVAIPALVLATLLGLDNADVGVMRALGFARAGPFVGFAADVGFYFLLLWLALCGVVFVSWRMVLISGWLFKAGFSYGFSPGRASATLLLFLFVGMFGANVAGVPIHPLSRLTEEGTADEKPVRRATTEKIAVEGCNLAGDDRVDRMLYAVDVFLPVIELHQECAFFIPENRKYWRMGKSAYAGLGLIVVSLTLLTFSGVLRRDLETSL